MAPVGTDYITSISERYVLPEIQEHAYDTNALYWRINQANKKQFAGGFQYEIPHNYAKFNAGGAYSGYSVLPTSPQDTVKNGVMNLKQYSVPVSFSGRDLAQLNSDRAIANGITTQWELARKKLSDLIGTDCYSDGVTDTNKIFGLKGAIDAGSVATSYQGLVRSSNTWLNSTVDSSTATLTLSALRSAVSSATIGGHSPTIILSRKEQYNRMWNLLIANQRFNVGRDDNLGNAGFTNLLFDNIPWVLDSKVFDGPNTSNSAILFLDEDTIDLVIWSGVDFMMRPFVKPADQDAMVGHLLWWGELVVKNPQPNLKMTNVSA